MKNTDPLNINIGSDGIKEAKFFAIWGGMIINDKRKRELQQKFYVIGQEKD